MVVEYSNLDRSRGTNPLGGIAFAVSALVFILVPISLIVIGFLANQPTGTLLSPAPQKTISEEITPTPQEEFSQPIIAADNSSSPSAVETQSGSNSSDHTATISAGQTEIRIDDKNVDGNSQILIIPQENDSSIYFVKSKGDEFFVLSVDQASTENRAVDYQVVGL